MRSTTALLLRAGAAAALLAGGAAGGPSATRLRTEYLESPLGIDVAAPRFSWELVHPQRAQAQTAYSLSVALASSGAVVWESGQVGSNKSLNVPYGGTTALAADTDFAWTVTWWDAGGVASAPATASFSTGLLTPADWRGAAWVGAADNTSNVYRAEFTLGAAAVTRARLYISGMGYYKSFLNGACVRAGGRAVRPTSRTRLQPATPPLGFLPCAALVVW